MSKVKWSKAQKDQRKRFKQAVLLVQTALKDPKVRARYDHVFTTGGIGPTHDDITADSVAKAFGVGIDHHPEVVARFRERWSEQELNEARLRMARIPDGAELIQSATILAPGFKLGNVIVMAGVPSIMQAMLDEVAPTLKTGAKLLSVTIRADAKEGDVGTELGVIAKANPDTIIGSYPFIDEDKKPNTNLVVRSRDPDKLNAAKTDVGWGHQIRSYVLQPYQMVKDLRTGVVSGSPDDVLDGDLDAFMEAALAQRVYGGGPDKVEDVE